MNDLRAGLRLGAGSSDYVIAPVKMGGIRFAVLGMTLGGLANTPDEGAKLAEEHQAKIAVLRNP